MTKITDTTKNSADLMQALQTLLQKGAVRTQQAMTATLQRQGFKVNQVKISRLLHKIGAVKMIENQQVVYRLPTDTLTITPSAALQQLILHIDHNECVIVVHTAPGCAQLVARLLDQQKTLGILGTVAGDDTIFIMPEKVSQITKNIKKITQFLLKVS